MNFISLLWNMINPFAFFNTRVKMPIVRLASAVIQHYKQKANQGITSAKDVLLRGGIVALATSVIIWISIFLYIVFYYTYMPALSHIRPVNLQFKACDDGPGACTFPAAHVSLTKKQQLLMVGQPYKVFLNLEMPESEANKKLGMFMVCAEMRDSSSKLRDHSCRSAMLHYRSTLLQTIMTITMSPLLVTGVNEEKQILPLELFSSYEEDQSYPVTDVYVEIQAKNIELYSATLYITAHFTGLRYIMFHWPILSAAIGISTNLFFIALICVLSWYHLSDTEWLEKTGSKYMRKLKKKKIQLEGEIEDSSVEDVSLLDDSSLEEECQIENRDPIIEPKTSSEE